MKPAKEKTPTERGKRILAAIAERQADDKGVSQTAIERAWMGEGRRGYLSRVISGDRGSSIDPEKAFELADLLGVAARWLWTGKGPKYEGQAFANALAAKMLADKLDASAQKATLDDFADAAGTTARSARKPSPARR